LLDLSLVFLVHLKNTPADGIVGNMRFGCIHEGIEIFESGAEIWIFTLSERRVAVDDPRDYQTLED
jgi:hypothetical protein